MANARPNLMENLPLLVSLGCALLPFLTVHLCYLLAASYGQVEWCIPYVDSCTSISATGRQPPAAYVFRGLMLPSAMLMMVFWWLHWAWLGSQNVHGRARTAMLILGVTSCIGLILYVTVLGEPGHLWRLQRRVGTILFFSFTFLAQLLLAGQLRSMDTKDLRMKPLGTRLLRNCQLMLAIGMFSVIVQSVSEAWHDTIEDAIEWQLALLLQVNFLFTVTLWWRKTAPLTFCDRQSQ